MDFEWDSETYCLETHEIVTEDGYILSLARLVEKSYPQKKIEDIDNSPQLTTTLKNKPPVLLVHGFLSSAIQWFINETPEKCLRKFLIQIQIVIIGQLQNSDSVNECGT